MTSGGSVDADGTLRLFCALDLPVGAREAIARWTGDNVPAGRRVARDDLHVTLVFLGRRPAGDVDGIVTALRASAAEARVGELSITRWRETPSVGMLVLDDPSGTVRALQSSLERRLVELGVHRAEQRAWLPHVTVVRHRARPGLCPETLPETRTFVPSEAAAYLSRLHPEGARYEALARVPLDPLTLEAV